MSKTLIFLFLFFPAICAAQIETDSARGLRVIKVKENPRYTSTVVGVSSVYLKNSYASPLTSKGVSVNLSNNETWYTKSGTSDLFLDLSVDFTGEYFEKLNSQIALSYFYHWLFYSKSNLFLYAGVGGSVDAAVLFNRGNTSGYNNISFVANSNVLPSLMLKYRLRIPCKNSKQQNFDLSLQAYTPLLGLGVYPSPMITIISKDKSSLFHFTSLHNHWGFGVRAFVDWRIRKKGIEKNTFLRFGYQYEGSRVNVIDGNTFQLSRGSFIIGVVSKF